MQAFRLYRSEDVSGVSGTGIVAEGVVFSDGTVIEHWLTGGDGLCIHKSIQEAIRIHGHNGATRIEMLAQVYIQASVSASETEDQEGIGLDGSTQAERDAVGAQISAIYTPIIVKSEDA